MGRQYEGDKSFGMVTYRSIGIGIGVGVVDVIPFTFPQHFLCLLAVFLRDNCEFPLLGLFFLIFFLAAEIESVGAVLFFFDPRLCQDMLALGGQAR